MAISCKLLNIIDTRFGNKMQEAKEFKKKIEYIKGSSKPST
jgi:hypothetical protein